MKNEIRIIQATQFAVAKHNGQFRSGSGEPYVQHCLRVGATVAKYTDDVEVIIAGILHDTVEDSDATVADIAEIFGHRVAELVLENSDDQSLPSIERKREQIRLMPSKSEPAQIIKIADTIDNGESILSMPPTWSKKSIIGYMTKKNQLVAVASIPDAMRAQWQAIWTAFQGQYGVAG